jgi:type IV secretory pathway TrbL component
VSFLITGLSGFADFGISVEGILIIIVGLIGVGLGCFLLLKQRRIPRALQTKDM